MENKSMTQITGVKILEKTILILFLAILIFSCTRVQQQTNDPAKETPKALKENDRDVSSFSFSKRMSNDLVDDLYKGLVDENQPLKEIENLIDENSTRKNDLLNTYTDFDNKNKSYYSAANSHAAAISDTILKARVLSMLKASSDKYNGKVSYLEAIIKHIEAKSYSVQDYYATMKIILTLPLIEKYQQTHLPKDSLYKGFYKQQEQIIKKINDITKN
jgi:hypothetical protein